MNILTFCCVHKTKFRNPFGCDLNPGLEQKNLSREAQSPYSKQPTPMSDHTPQEFFGGAIEGIVPQGWTDARSVSKVSVEVDCSLVALRLTPTFQNKKQKTKKREKNKANYLKAPSVKYLIIRRSSSQKTRCPT